MSIETIYFCKASISNEMSRNLIFPTIWYVCNKQRLRPTCAYAQFDQSLCLSLKYSMIVKQLTELHSEFLSLTGGCTGLSESATLLLITSLQSEFPRPIPWNSVESDLGCTSRIYFDNVTLTLHNLTLASQKPCQHNNKCDCSKTNTYK